MDINLYINNIFNLYEILGFLLWNNTAYIWYENIKRFINKPEYLPINFLLND